MEVDPILSSFIPVSYETDDVKVSLNIEFGKGKDSSYEAYLRTGYEEPYTIEKFDVDGKEMFRLLTEEGPFVLKINNVNVVSKKNLYKRDIYNGYVEYSYGITSVLDMNTEPVYDTPISFQPSNNIERDGKPWIVKNKKNLRVDQNGEAKYQWSTAKALEKGVKPTPEQELMGVEERHENSGMIYITIQPIYTEETHYNEVEEEPLMRGGGGLTRGFNSGTTRGLTRGLDSGVTRGIKSSAARVGYGGSAKTASKSVSAIPIPNSRFILPIRLRTIGDSSDNTKCAKDLTSAMRVEELQKKTTTIPDFD